MSDVEKAFFCKIKTCLSRQGNVSVLGQLETNTLNFFDRQFVPITDQYNINKTMIFGRIIMRSKYPVGINYYTLGFMWVRH